MVKQDAAGAVHSISLSVVSSQIKACHLADPIRRSGMETGKFRLGHFLRLTKHLARSGEIEAALRHQIPERRQQVMGAVDVGIQS